RGGGAGAGGGLAGFRIRRTADAVEPQSVRGPARGGGQPVPHAARGRPHQADRDRGGAGAAGGTGRGDQRPAEAGGRVRGLGAKPLLPPPPSPSVLCRGPIAEAARTLEARDPARSPQADAAPATRASSIRLRNLWALATSARVTERLGGLRRL